MEIKKVPDLKFLEDFDDDYDDTLENNIEQSTGEARQFTSGAQRRGIVLNKTESSRKPGKFKKPGREKLPNPAAFFAHHDHILNGPQVVW